MARAGPRVALLLLAAIAFAPIGNFAFKEGEFKKCNDSGFCKRLRGTKGDGYELQAGSVSVKGSEVTAKVQNSLRSSSLELKLTAYDGFFRLFIDEDAPNRRYQVPYVLIDSLDDHKQPWAGSKSTAASTTLQLGDATVVLNHKPFKLEVKRGREALLTLNGRSLFQYEQRREKQEGDPEGWWEESFKSFTDSKPKGPQAISMDIGFPGSDHVYGIPERAKSLALPPTAGEGVESEPYRMYNLDVFEYLEDSPFGLYGAIPVMISHKATSTVGVFWLNAAEMLVDVEKSKQGTETQWLADSGVLDLFIYLGPSIENVLQRYSWTTGTTQMPQMFAIGYHQCRWNYRDEADVRMVDETMDAYDIPYDVIWLDIEHTDGKRYFTWDATHFPHPLDMQARLSAHGRKVVTIIDPHIKKDPGYYIYQEAQSKGLLTKNKDGSDFDGWCWPGASVYIDMLNPAAVSWWAEQFKLSSYKGSTKDLYVWNDMNEPSVFNGPEATMQKDVLHHGDVEHRDLHNLHGLLFHRATSLGLAARGAGLSKEGDRPFVLTRSFFAGSQRWGPMWTGDNAATWGALKVSVPMLLSSSLAGYPWAGADVGGFFGNPDAELFTRFYQLGAFYPFFRGHAHLDTARREPWVFGEPTTSRVKDAIKGRYVLLPYLYTLFRQSHENGSAILRPLWYEFPSQPEVFATDDQLLLGPSIMVAPVLEAGQTARSVVLPAGAIWYNATSGAVAAAAARKPQTLQVAVTMDGIPTFFRGGSILATRQRARRNTAAAAQDPYTLVVALDESGSAAGSLYVDDGQSFAHESGHFSKTDFTFEKGALSSKVVAGGFKNDLVVERVVILGLGKPGSKWSAEVQPSGQKIEATWGPLALKPGLPATALILRKPDLPVSQEWSLLVKKG